jgi:hypothetical protein
MTLSAALSAARKLLSSQTATQLTLALLRSITKLLMHLHQRQQHQQFLALLLLARVLFLLVLLLPAAEVSFEPLLLLSALLLLDLLPLLLLPALFPFASAASLRTLSCCTALKKSVRKRRCSIVLGASPSP